MIERALEPHQKRTESGSPGKSLSESCLLDLKSDCKKRSNLKLKLFKPLTKFPALSNINIKSPFKKAKSKENQQQIKSPMTLGKLYRSEINLAPSNFDNISQNSDNSEYDKKETASFSESSSSSETDENTVLENFKHKSNPPIHFREAFVAQTSDSLETNESVVSGSGDTDSVQTVPEIAENVLFSDQKCFERNEAQFKMFLTRLNLMVEDRLGEFV